MATMKAVVIHQVSKGTKGLKISDWPKPAPGDDEVLIKVVCFGLNYADTLIRRGTYDGAPPFPLIPGYECSGVVDAVGANVKNIKVGRRVLAFTKFGAYAEYVVANALSVTRIPKGMSFVHAASIPVQFVTAYHCLWGTGPVRKGERVMIHSAAGGVGLAAVQLAHHAGLDVVATVGSDAKVDHLKRNWGVAHVINYRNENFSDAVEKIYGTKQCLDIVLDPNGGPQLKTEQKLLRPCGRVVSFGAASISDRSGFMNTIALLKFVSSMLTFSAINMLRSSTGVTGVSIGKFAVERPDIFHEYLTAVIDLFKADKIKVSVSKVYDWNEIGQAHEDLESRATTGKLILRVCEDPQ